MIKGRFKPPRKPLRPYDPKNPTFTLDMPLIVPDKVRFYGPPTPTSMITKTVIERICKGVLSTGVEESAVEMAGIPQRRFRAWMKRGRAEIERREHGGEPNLVEDLYVSLVESIDRARHTLEHALASKWVEAITETQGKKIYKTQVDEKTGEEVRYLDCEVVTGSADSRGIAEFLARRFPERWRKRETMEVSGEGGGPVKVDQRVVNLDLIIGKLPIEVQRALLEAIEGEIGEGGGEGERGEGGDQLREGKE